MPKCDKYHAKWKADMAKCSKYHAKCRVTMPKCSKYHAKWQVLVPNCCKYKANGPGKESQKKSKTWGKKKKNYSIYTQTVLCYHNLRVCLSMFEYNHTFPFGEAHINPHRSGQQIIVKKFSRYSQYKHASQTVSTLKNRVNDSIGIIR